MSPLGRALWGAVFGLAISVLGLAVGAVRIVGAMAGGRGIRFDNLQVLLYYIGGFAGAGALIGLLWPLTHSRAGRYAVGFLAAAALVTSFAVGVAGPPARWDGAWLFSWLLSSLFFGLVIGRNLRHSAPTH